MKAMKSIESMKGTILIVDDNVKWCKSLALNFTQRGYATCHATNRAEALSILSTQPVHMVLLDIMLGEENGVELLGELLLLQKDLPVVMITGFGSIDTAVDSIKLGAFDYVTKPVDFDKLLRIVEHALSRVSIAQNRDSASKHPGAISPSLITQNAQMLALCEKARKFANTDLPILIMGENGTGKEIIADFIHMHSQRNTQPMLKINCASFPETLLDNELFGHEKGAYTGANSIFKGVFERAQHSSLFLDEIGDMPLTIQAKILRTLQNHEIRRLGGQHNVHVDVRFLAATNKNLGELMQRKAFREDLYYRLNVATIRVPALRERRDDIPLLADYFLTEYTKLHETIARSFSKAVMTRLRQYEWAGNVRELRNTVNYAATITTDSQIDLDDLPPHFRNQTSAVNETDNVRERMERNLILDMLEKVNYNKKKAAELLHISRKTLYNKLDKYGITIPK
jgi:DNA-binding NtrC family response regulator